MAETKIKRRKPAAERKQRAITVWVDAEQGDLLDRAAAVDDDPVATWVRKTAVKAARAALGEGK